MMDIVPADSRHVYGLAPRIRDQDREKCIAIRGDKPGIALHDTYARSQRAWTVLIDGEEVAMFGVVGSAMSSIGIPWLICGERLLDHPVAFARQSKKYLPLLAEGYDVLINYVIDTNEVAKKWLRWLGFTLGQPAPYGVKQELFRSYEYRGSK